MLSYKISIIIPSLNEEKCISETLASLQQARIAGHEVILSDGGSIDHTIDIAQPLVDVVVTAQAGRALQMNHGAAQASGDILWFIHADSIVPLDADTYIIDSFTYSDNVWGRFDIRLSGAQRIFRLIEFMINLRSRITGIATGDQGIFMLRYAFDQVGGFAEIPLMEDIAISNKLKRIKAPVYINKKITTSSRRWEQNGIIKTILLMWWLRLAFYFGISPRHLAKIYHPQ
jgi:rSAM/selenodomain-associated transferase 2